MGVRVGQTLAEARALCPELVHADHEPHKDRQALEVLARWMLRYSPAVQCADDLPAIFIDLGGCERLFGGLGKLARRIESALKRMGVHATLAIAPTPGAAWALASSGVGGKIIRPKDLAVALAMLPVRSLRLPLEIAEDLFHLGVETIGQLMQLPREAIPARFGVQLLLRLNQAMGNVPELIVPLTEDSPIEAGMEFDGAIDSLETIWLVFKDLIARIVGQLAKRGRGARQIQFDLFRSDGVPVSRRILLSRPSRDPVNLFNLMRCGLEGMGRQSDEATKRRSDGGEGRRHGGTKARSATTDFTSVAPAGFVTIELKVLVHEPVSEEQISLLEQEEHNAQRELDRLIERLLLRLGEEAVLRPIAMESYVPERAVGYGSSQNVEVKMQKSKVREPSAFHNSAFSIQNSAFPRPLHLLPRPVELRVMVSPSDDRDGRPIAVTEEGRTRRIVHAMGPERIAGQWWQGHDKTRDYFEIEDETGRRSWVFRVRETSRWFRHGEFE